MKSGQRKYGGTLSQYLIQSARAVLMMEELAADLRAQGYVQGTGAAHDTWWKPEAPGLLARAWRWLND